MSPSALRLVPRLGRREAPLLVPLALCLASGIGAACQKPSPVEDGAVEPKADAAEAETTASRGAPRAAAFAAAEAMLTAAEAATASAAEPPPEPAPEPEPVWTLPEDYLRFDGACSSGDRVRLAFAGDLLLHEELQIQAYASEDGAAVLWASIADLLAEPDLTYLNLEGPMAWGLDRDFLELEDPGRVFDKVVYSAYPRFNYHASIAKDLVDAGVDIVSTANNHALDRGPLGVERTIAALHKAKLAFAGTRPSAELERLYTVTEVGAMKIAWIACTRNTNRIPDDLDQVLQCGTGTAVDQLIRRLRGAGRKGARKPKVDAVIVTPHWGKEYVHTTRAQERALAQRWVEAGALAVIGSHPHVVQPWDKLAAEDGREGLVFYSLGNFASHQPELSRRSSLLLYVDLVRAEDGEVHIAGVRYVPLHVREDSDEFFVEAIDREQGPADARALMVALLGPGNLALPGEIKRGDPHCDEDWRPHPIPEWAELEGEFVIPGTETGDGDGDASPGPTSGP